MALATASHTERQQQHERAMGQQFFRVCSLPLLAHDESPLTLRCTTTEHTRKTRPLPYTKLMTHSSSHALHTARSMQALAAPGRSHSPGGRATRPHIASFRVRLIVAVLLLLTVPRFVTSSSSLSPPSSSSSTAACSLENFEAFCLEFHKDYSANPQEVARRFEAWTKSCLFLENYKVEHPDASFHMAYNPLSDRLPEEHEAMFGYKVKPRTRREPSSSASDSINNSTTRRGLQGFHKRDRSEDKGANEEADDDAYPVPSEWAKELEPRQVPTAVDWRVAKLNPDNVVAVTPVKNQAACGACWAFTTAAAVEGAVAVTTKVLNELSNQELIDCVRQNEGCNGGDFDYAFRFVADKGLVSSSDYKFTQSQGTCRTGQFPIASRIKDAYMTRPCDKDRLMSIVARRPVAVAIDGSCEAFVQYRGGVYTQSCGNDLNHAVTIVGYGTDEKTGTDYWVRSSIFRGMGGREGGRRWEGLE